ncbi:MAG: MBL fold metallo-hydrolase [Bacteroidales bacterium]|nr:MBL fold metallo-hydrolase [Bacteroidales bacterium]
MTLTFLGTGTSQGVPVIACPCNVCHSTDPHDIRLRTSALVSDSGNNNILIDIGPDFRSQMLTNNVQHLEAILITHAHRDHVGGIDDIRPFNWIQKQNMQIYGNTTALQTIKHSYYYIFEYHQYPGLPEATLNDVGDCKPFRIGNTTVTPVKGLHKDLPVLGYRLDDTDGSSMAYITDMNHIDDDELQKLLHLDVLVINALRLQKHFSHFCLPESLSIIEKCKPKQAYLTHMSHEMGFHADVNSTLPKNVNLAYDNLKLIIKI